MSKIQLVLIQLIFLLGDQLLAAEESDLPSWAKSGQDAFKGAAVNDAKLKKDLEVISRQMMLQQFYTEERVRSEGNSGVKQVRGRYTGRRNYFASTHTGGSIAAIHDHSNNIRTVGMGEFIGVLNGIEFRTRHNDYRLVQPSRTTKTFNAVEDIPFPGVPKEVTDKPTIKEQIEEMREWFKAWRDQDDSVRKYKDYFKPVLCYLEGAWQVGDTGGNIDEPFMSDRHKIEAKTWFELQDFIRFTSYTGTKNRNENLAFLPTKLFSLQENGAPLFAQWNYRILCHPLAKDVPLNSFHLMDDLHVRMRTKQNIHRYADSRAARFTVNVPEDGSADRPAIFTFQDTLMNEIPGKDNYPGDITEAGIYDEDVVLDKDSKKLNVARYHRAYKIQRRDAMGSQIYLRGFSDNALYVALNTQDRIPPMKIKNRRKCTGWGKRRTCELIVQKVSYAIPLEIIYLTPLNTWNPYNLKYRGESRSDEGKKVFANDESKWGRNGGCKDDTVAYNGLNSKVYYLTPTEFFTGREQERDSADTTRGSGVCVLNEKGERKKVMASGIRTFFPPIKNVGVLRQRYPIMPIHGEGSSVFKELNALKDIVLDINSHQKLLYNTEIDDTSPAKWFLSSSTGTNAHSHFVFISPIELQNLKAGKTLSVTTSRDNSHSHDLLIRWSNSQKKIVCVKCDDKYKCFDGHARVLTKETENGTAS